MSKRIVMNLLADRPIAYHPDIARVSGGAKAGIFLSQLLYWSDKGKRDDGYIWKTQEDWENETALTRREQETARRILKSKGLLDEKLRGVPAKLYYKINTDVLYAMLENLYVQTSMYESAILDDTEAPNSDAQKCQTITESTIDNTKITAAASPALAAYEQTFGPMSSQIQAQKLADDIEEFGETAVTEAIKAAAAAGARSYGWSAARLRNRKGDAVKQSAAAAIWEGEVQPYMSHTKRWAELTPAAQKIIRKVGGQSRLREVREGFELDQLKREVMGYV